MILEYFVIVSAIHHEWLAMRHSYAFDWFVHTMKTMIGCFDRFPTANRIQMRSENQKETINMKELFFVIQKICAVLFLTKSFGSFKLNFNISDGILPISTHNVRVEIA